MNVGDEVKYRPHGDQSLEYRGIIAWIDDEDIGISIIAPPEVRGSYETVSIKDASASVIAKYNPKSFKAELSKLTPAELKAEIELIRAGRVRSAAAKPAKAQTKEDILIRKLSHLPDSVIDELIKKATE